MNRSWPSFNRSNFSLHFTHKILYLTLITGILLILSTLSGCKKSGAPSPSGEMAEAEMMEDGEVRENSADKISEDQIQKKRDDSSQSISPQDVLPTVSIDKRLLEYSMSLNYVSKDILVARLKLFSIISRYGFLTSSTTDISSDQPYLSVSCKVRTDDIYSMLKQLEGIGILDEENVSVNDMTPDNKLRDIQQKTELIRAARREAALNNSNSTRRNYEERERMLEQSENNMDSLDFQLWQLKDRASWSSVTISVQSPDKPIHIHVPSFYNAVIQMINGVLTAIYIIIRFSPLIVILAVVVILKRKKIIPYILKKKSKSKENTQ